MSQIYGKAEVVFFLSIKMTDQINWRIVQVISEQMPKSYLT